MENQKTVEELEMELEHFKKSMNEWVMFLNQCFKETNEKMLSLERRLSKLELDSELKNL